VKTVDYLIPYPYTVTIALLLFSTISILIFYRKKINWFKYWNSLGHSWILGVAEIHDLENNGNVESWYFPEGSALLGVAWGKVYWEDIFFVPACFSLFYLFMWWIRDIKDVIPKWTYVYWCSAAVVIEALIFQVAGQGIRNLMIPYTLVPLMLFIFYCIVTKRQINVTHAIVTLLFVAVFSMVWELFNAWRQHWIYNIHCDLMGDNGWFFYGKLHAGIFFQYAYSGFVIVYASCTIFGEKDDYLKAK
jgi:hypothetical protein